MKTLALDKNWDIGLDDIKNIAIKSGNDRLAQDVASSVRVFKGECPFDIQRGIEYNKPDEIRETLQNDINEQAKRVEGVKDSVVLFDKLSDRKLTPSIYVVNEENEQVVV